MNTDLIWELIGYAGSALVLISLLMSSIFKLRVINAIGSLVFCVYAFKIHSIPTAIMNICLVGIDIYYLIRLLSPAQKTFSSIEVSSGEATVRYILDNFREDIIRYFDTASIEDADKVLLIYDNETVAGLLAGVSEGNNLRIIIDYSTPQYRDCKVAAYLYEKLSGMYSNIVYSGSNEKHISFCRKMGFVKNGDSYIKKL